MLKTCNFPKSNGKPFLKPIGSIVRSRPVGENELKTTNGETKVSGGLGSKDGSLTEGDSAIDDQRSIGLILKR